MSTDKLNDILNDILNTGTLSVNSIRQCEKMLLEASFVQGFQEMQAKAARINTEKGFNSDDELINEFQRWFTNKTLDAVTSQEPESIQLLKFQNIFDSFRHARVGLKLMLATGELGETLEAVRKNLGNDDHCPEFTAEEIEVADAVIRLMNYAHDRKLRLAEAIVAKINYNGVRKDHSKEARESKHGKRF